MPVVRRPSTAPAWRGTAALATAVLLLGLGSAGCGPVAAPSPAPTADTAATTHDDPSVYLLLRLGERRLYLMDADPQTPAESFPIAVGRKGLETPTGRYEVEEMVEHPEYVKIDRTLPSQVAKRIPPGPTNPLGERWIGFAHGEGWTVGIHGTPNPELLGRAVSHGCVRMRNADVIRIYERVQLGTPVVVEP